MSIVREQTPLFLMPAEMWPEGDVSFRFQYGDERHSRLTVTMSHSHWLEFGEPTEITTLIVRGVEPGEQL